MVCLEVAQSMVLVYLYAGHDTDVYHEYLGTYVVEISIRSMTSSSKLDETIPRVRG